MTWGRARPATDLRRGRHAAVLCVANWLPAKGVLELVDAVAMLPDDEVTLHLAGSDDVDAEYRDRILGRLSVGGLAERVVVHGPIDRPTVAGLYAGADVFALPTSADAYATAAAEALRAGLPVVGWNAANLPNLLTDGVEGCLVEPGDVAALSAALHRLAADDAHRARLASAAAHGEPPCRPGPTRRSASSVSCERHSPRRLNQRTTGPVASMSRRLTLASSTYILQATPGATPSAHAKAALIGLTWVTTTTTEVRASAEHSAQAIGDPCGELGEGLAAARRQVVVRPPARPHVVRHGRGVHLVELAVVQLDPARIDADVAADRLGRLLRPPQRAADHDVGPREPPGQPRRLLDPPGRQRRIGPPEQGSSPIGVGLAVADQQQHVRLLPAMPPNGQALRP